MLQSDAVLVAARRIDYLTGSDGAVASIQLRRRRPYLPREDRDFCTKHGTNAKPQSNPEPEKQPQPRRVVSVGRTRPLYDVTAGSSALDKIEDIVNRAMMEGEFTIDQRGIMRWAIRKCRSIMTKLREEFESL